MDETMKNALARVLEDYEQRRDREISARKAEQAELEQFLSKAVVALDSIVMPCFQRFSEMLEAHHHTCTIAVEKQGDEPRRSDPKIIITIFPEGARLPQGNPWLSYAASSHRQKIAAHRCINLRSGGAIPGPVGEYEVDQITPALVDAHLLDLAQTVFGQT